MMPETWMLVMEVRVLSGMLDMLDEGLCRKDVEVVDTDAVSNCVLRGNREKDGILNDDCSQPVSTTLHDGLSTHSAEHDGRGKRKLRGWREVRGLLWAAGD
jgi:hypothetical protein